MVSHTVLLVVGGALLTGLLGALVFGSSGTAEEKRLREQQKLLRALEAQRRIREVQLMREARRRGASIYAAPPPVAPEPEPTAPEPMPDEVQEAERRAAERQRKREEKEQAVALKATREAEKRAQRRAEQERKSAAKAERAAQRAAEQQHKRDEKERSAHEQAERTTTVEHVPAPAQPDPPEQSAPDKTLSELPLYSWAIEAEDQDRAP